MTQQTTEEFAEVAIEIIDDFVEEPNAVWVTVEDSVAVDSDKPWKIQQAAQPTETEVKIVFYQGNLIEREFLNYRKDSLSSDGEINAIMYPYDFEPTLKDVVRWNGRELTVKSIDPIQPIDEVIAYMFRLGT